ncbi:hypothetical protein BT69DRAFT_1357821 [Atractiella rhizophila]|nr:hypothetical protein BT69DRAFT_1357821 [Atractiella rhizophila]
MQHSANTRLGQMHLRGSTQGSHMARNTGTANDPESDTRYKPLAPKLLLAVLCVILTCLLPMSTKEKDDQDPDQYAWVFVAFIVIIFTFAWSDVNSRRADSQGRTRHIVLWLAVCIVFCIVTFGCISKQFKKQHKWILMLVPCIACGWAIAVAIISHGQIRDIWHNFVRALR